MSDEEVSEARNWLWERYRLLIEPVLLGGGKSRGGMLGKLGSAAGRRGRTKASKERLDAAENKVERLQESLADLEADLTEEVTEIDSRWMSAAKQSDTMQVPLEKTAITVSELVLAWIPVD